MKSDVGEYVITDNGGYVIASIDKTIKDQQLSEGSKLISSNEWLFDDMAIHLVAIDFEVDQSSGFESMWVNFAIVGILIGGILVISYLFISKNVVTHLKRINLFINSISQGDYRNLKKRISPEGAKEICDISYEINCLLDEVSRLTKHLVHSTSHLYRAEISRKEAELSYLKSQINPHFLYNTLNVVKSIASLYGQSEIEKLTMSLVKIFRYSIKGEEMVLLSQELDIVDAYIQIQMIRFENSFEVEYDIEGHLFETKVVKMILQPILENAIQHGVENSYDKNHILITGRETSTYLEFGVIDDGVGISSEKLKSINEALDCDELSCSNETHIGILNVHHRLKHYYGDDSGIVIESVEGQGTHVYLRINSGYVD